MKAFLAIFRKELRRYLTDPRMLLALFLPGILILLVYPLMGTALQGLELSGSPEGETFSIAYMEDFSEEREEPVLLTLFDSALEEQAKGNSASYFPVPREERDEAMGKVRKGEYDLLLDYSPSFEDVLFDRSDVPSLALYYDGASEKATYAHALMLELVPLAYDGYLLNQGADGPIEGNLGEGDYQGNQLISFLFPLITVSLLMSSVCSLTPEAIAGEKERGTLAALLIAPVPRGTIVWGKMASAGTVSLLSGAVSFLGTVLSLPFLMGGSGLSPALVFPVLLIIFSALFLFLAIGFLLSTLARSVKEANSWIGPFLSVGILASVFGAFLDLSALPFAFVPVLNVATCMALVIRSEALPWAYLTVTILINLLATVLLVFLTDRLFRSERALFRR